ncbi:hypothetical protein BE17_37695 [Sorangium cellulosum]|uniref:Uncharacterized protein n=1 Tax=Sorangium cellulosum TaxID=56 RepID=A0A150R3B6_SORCE|nr:hypothetical protein BE17_37695 [Sorangium cellulosum]
MFEVEVLVVELSSQTFDSLLKKGRCSPAVTKRIKCKVDLLTRDVSRRRCEFTSDDRCQPTLLRGCLAKAVGQCRRE